MLTDSEKQYLLEGGATEQFIEENQEYGKTLCTVLLFIQTKYPDRVQYVKRCFNSIDLEKETDEALTNLEFLCYTIDWNQITDGTYLVNNIAGVEWALMENLYVHEKRNAAHRLSINNINKLEQLRAVMMEGVEETRVVLNKLQLIAPEVKKNQQVHCLGGRMMPYFNVLMAFDDMNMRGMQIVYAAEYCDNDYQKMINLVLDRDRYLIAYVNKCSANSKDPMPQKAVHGGASATDPVMQVRGNESYHIMSEDRQAFRALNIDKIKIDYHKMDIVSHIDAETAIKIAQTWGFEVVTRYAINKSYDLWGDSTEKILMFNSKTGDILEACATSTDMCYGGCRIIAIRPNGSVQSAFLDSQPGVHGNSERFESNGTTFVILEADYRRGVFREYKYIHECDFDMSNINYNNIPVNGNPQLPMLDSYSSSALSCMARDLPEEFIGEYYQIIDRNDYTIMRAVNALLMPDMIEKHLTGKIKDCYVRWLEDKFTCLFENTYATNLNEQEFSKVMRFAFIIAGKTEYEEYEKAYKAHLKAYFKENPRNQAWFGDINKISFTPTDKEKTIMDLRLKKCNKA